MKWLRATIAVIMTRLRVTKTIVTRLRSNKGGDHDKAKDHKSKYHDKAKGHKDGDYDNANYH